LAGADLGSAIQPGYRSGLLYAMQRVSGVVAFVFIVWHVYSLRLSFYFYDQEIDHALMHGILSTPWWFAFYAVGVLASLFHFCNGLYTFCITWGLTVSERSQAAMQRFGLALFAVLGTGALGILAAFR
jgi:succinate dehydrogenase / fumarate reductase cytochrome b subunit